MSNNDIDAAWAALASLSTGLSSVPDNADSKPVSKQEALIAHSSVQLTKKRKHEEHERVRRAQSLAFLHDAMGEQLVHLWRANGASQLAHDDFVTGSADPAAPCDQCQPEVHGVKLYLIVPDVGRDGADKAAKMIETLRRQAKARQLYLRDSAMEAAEHAGVIGREQHYSEHEQDERAKSRQNSKSVYNCLLHACVEQYCVLPLTATARQRALYNLVHARQIATVANGVEQYVYFCKRHLRFHLCDEFCDQSQTSRHEQRVCVLSGKTLVGLDERSFSYNDGTGTRDQTDSLGAASALRTEASDPGGAPVRRRANYSEVGIIRDRNGRSRMRGAAGGRRRGRGRGRGSVADTGRRQYIERVRQAQYMNKSSGDADAAALTPGEDAARLDRLVSGGSAVSIDVHSSQHTDSLLDNNNNSNKNNNNNNDTGTNNNNSNTKSSTSSTAKRRKMGKAKRVKPRIAGVNTRMTLMVPAYMLDDSLNVDGVFDELPISAQFSDVFNQPLVKPEPMDTDAAHASSALRIGPETPQAGDRGDELLLNSRLASVKQEPQEKISADSDGGAAEGKKLISVSFDIHARIPFAEREHGKYDTEFALDILEEQHMRAERIERFRIGGNAAHNTFFSSSELFEQFGERACAIFWRLLGSHEREAIEAQKRRQFATRLRSDLDAYCVAQSKARGVVMVDQMQRICTDVTRQIGLAQSLVIDEPLWKIHETYCALLVIEFYFNLVSLPDKLSMHLTNEASETIKSQFFFENFVPAIMCFMREGLTVKGVVILPRDTFLLREWWPPTATLRTLGIADQTMTHLRTTIQAYIAAANGSNISMRRFEATVLDNDELIQLRLPGVIPNSEHMTSRQLGRAAARRTVELFIEKRAARLRSLSRL
jgi:hypothetical protein